MSDFSKLLDYLEAENVTNNTEPIPEKKPEKKRAEVKEQPKKIEVMDYQNLASDIPTFNVEPDEDISGFNLGKFKNNLRRKLVNDYIRSSNYNRPYFSVSEMTGCIRKAYYKRLKYKVNVESLYKWPYLYLVLKVGNTVHSVVQEFYDFDESEKTIISEKYKIKGRIDALKGNILFELKTLDPNKFDNNYKEMHYRQGLIYAYILNNYYDYNIHGISIVYIMRTLKDIKSFNIPYDEKLAQSLMDNATYLKQSIESKVVPESIGKIEEDCKWCEYKNYCENDIKIVKEEKSDDPIFLL